MSRGLDLWTYQINTAIWHNWNLQNLVVGHSKRVLFWRSNIPIICCSESYCYLHEIKQLQTTGFV